MLMPESHHLHQLTGFLSEHRSWWQFRPFHYAHNRWQYSHPGLYQQFEALSETELHELERDQNQRVHWLKPWMKGLSRVSSLCQLPMVPLEEQPYSPHWQRDIPGRKWQQIRQFSPHVPTEVPLVEWCAGKGHLGRYLSLSQQQNVRSLEWQSSLCEAGTVLASQHHAQQTFHVLDVFSQQTAEHLDPSQHAVAMHACCDLHQELVQQVTKLRLKGLSLSPCCYHLCRHDEYQPMSQQAQEHNLYLSRDDLSMCLRQTVTAGQKERQQRQQELLWRLAFDSYQRQLRNTEQYMPLPTLPKALLKGQFSEFILWCCERKQLQASVDISLEECLIQAEKRVRHNREMELIQHCFQRPIEIWLALDKVVFLQQQGYEAGLEVFCDYQLTPRNLIIKAWC